MTGGTARRWFVPILWAALTLALAIAIPRLPWSHAAAVMAGADAGWIALAVIANLVILPLWAKEWTLLVPGRGVRFPTMLEIVATSAAVLNSIPMLAGEASAVALLVTRAGLSRGAAISVLALDQLLVAFAKIAVLTVAAVVSPLPSWVKAGAFSLAAAFGALTILLFALSHRWEVLSGRLPSSRRWSGYAARIVGLGRHLETLRHPGRTIAVSLIALAKKAAEIAAVVAVQVALGVPADLAAATVVIAALALSTLVPIAPANVGVYEATVFAVYRFLGLAPEIALALAIVQHLCFLVPSVVPGYLTLTLRQLVPGWRQAG